MFIPKPLRKEYFWKSHDTHQGINSTTTKLKKSVWWPHMDSDVTYLIQQHNTCMQQRPQTQDETFEWPTTKPWTRLHVDWARINKKNISVIVDSGSG